MKVRLELHGCLMFFATICIAGAVITMFFIPETKGKNLIAEEAKETEVMLNQNEKKVWILPTRKLNF